MILSLSEIIFSFINLIIALSFILGINFLLNVNDSILSNSIAKTISTLLAYKGNILTSNKDKLTNEYSFLLRKISLPRDINGYIYKIKFDSFNDYERVSITIDELNIDERSIIKKNGCKILNQDGETSFEISSDEISTITMKLTNNGDCKLYIYY